MKFKHSLNKSLRRNTKAVSPAISTVILTSAVVVLLLVTIVFANNFLNARISENEFSAMEQFMQSVGLQIDDVAWLPGSARTIRYASRYGHVKFEPNVLNYSVYVNGEWWNFTTGILLFNMPISHYSLGNGYYRSVYPSNNSFLNYGPAASVSYVFVVEKLPMHDGGFIRIVVVPIIRVLNTTNNFKLHLPILSNGTSPNRSQSVTLNGKNVSVRTKENVATITIYITFLRSIINSKPGFNRDFFNFRNETVVVPTGGASVEFYTGEVMVSLGI